MKLYLKKYGWILLAVTVGLLLTFFWFVAQAGHPKKTPRVVRPAGLDKPLPDGAPDLANPVLPDDPQVNLAPFTSFMKKAAAIDAEIKARKDAERISAANKRYR